MSAGVQPGTVPSDFSQFDQILPPEVTAYVKQKIIRIPHGYVDRWESELGPYNPLRDEALMCSGLYPGLSVKEWHADFLDQPFPIVRRVDRGFPTRYEEFRRDHRFDVNLLERLGADDLGGAEDELYRLDQDLKDMQWWPIADFPLLGIMFLEG